MAQKKIPARSKLFEALSGSGKQFSDVTLLFHDLVAQRSGLAGSDHKYLGMLVEKGAMTAGELATLSGLTTGAITGVIDRLEKQSLVKRVRDKDDRRKVLVVPDREKAWKRLAPVFSRLEQKLAGVYSQFSEKETEIVVRYLNTISSAMTELVNELKSTEKE